MRVLVFLLTLLSFTASASAFHEIESFSRIEDGGGAGNFFTGSPRFKGYNCRICHTQSEGKISIGMEVNRPELQQGQYETNTGYVITLRLVGEHRGLGSAFNPNTFMLEFVNDQGESMGEYLPGPAPVELVDEGRVLAAEGFGEGEDEWSFTWFSPREASGPITLHLAMLDGNGADETELRFIDPLEDDVATMTLRLCPVGESCPKPASPAEIESAVHCSVMGTSASSGVLLWLLIGLLLLARKRLWPGLLLLLFFAACASPTAKSSKAAVGTSAPGGDMGRRSGIRITYALPGQPELSEEAKIAFLEQALPILGNRLEELRLRRPIVLRLEDQIVVELAQEDQEQLDRVRRILPQAAELSFRLVQTGTNFMKNLCASIATDSKAAVMKIETGLDVWQAADGSTVKECYLSAVDRTAMLNSEEASAEGCKSRGDSERTACVVSGRRILERYLSELKLEVGEQLLFELSESSALEDENGQRFWRSYYLHEKVALSGHLVQGVRVQDDDEVGTPQLLLEFTREGQRRVAELTRSNIGRKLAIVLDGRIQSAPVIRDAITGGTVLLHLGPDASRADDLAMVLRSGALPTPLVEVSLSYF
jgi:hypothetical protein